jgi:hypothetical protein
MNRAEAITAPTPIDTISEMTKPITMWRPVTRAFSMKKPGVALSSGPISEGASSTNGRTSKIRTRASQNPANTTTPTNGAIHQERSTRVVIRFSLVMTQLGPC